MASKNLDAAQSPPAPETAKPRANADKPATDDGLVAMTNAGEVLRVHPSCVSAHSDAGWTASK